MISSSSPDLVRACCWTWQSRRLKMRYLLLLLFLLIFPHLPHRPSLSCRPDESELSQISSGAWQTALTLRVQQTRTSMMVSVNTHSNTQQSALFCLCRDEWRLISSTTLLRKCWLYFGDWYLKKDIHGIFEITIAEAKLNQPMLTYSRSL